MVIKKILQQKENYNIIRKSDFFDASWYRHAYHIRGDAALHYLSKGAKLGYNPSPNFSRIKYELIYEDVRYTKTNPVLHYEKYGCYEETFTKDIYICDKEKKALDIIKNQQDVLISKQYDPKTENLIIFLVPEMDKVNGGIMSINSIANITKDLRTIHNSEVIICTMPNPKTFNKYTFFDSPFDIYRFDQITQYFKNLKNVIIHIPEIYVYPFLYFITPDQQLWLKSIKNVQINILNQNIDFIPRPRYVEYLKKLSNKVTMTCAHKKYCTQQLRTSYNIDVHFLSTSNLTKYEYKSYSDKKDLLVYSPDQHPMKEKILNKIKKNFPNLEIQEIKNLTYPEYLKTISKAKWMITFGEGLDGYFSESLRSGTLSFSVYNPSFFDGSYNNKKNIFKDYAHMYEKIVETMNTYNNQDAYEKLVNECCEIDAKLYNDDEYVDNIKQFYLGNYTWPLSDVLDARAKRLTERPLISVALAVYNGERYIDEQIKSILNQDYKNIEVIISDDGSTDKTLEIIQQYGDKVKVFHNKKNHGLIGNFLNAIKQCSGEYIALSDQDDIWEPNKIRLLLERIDNFDIVQSGICVIDKNGNYYPSKAMHTAYEIDKTTKYGIQDNIKENTSLGCTTLMNADFVRRFIKVPKDIIYHDAWFLYNAIINGKGIVYIDEQLVKYRQHGKNTAYLTYSSNTWMEKKIRADKCLLKSFPNLDDTTRRAILLDINYNILRGAFAKEFPNNLDKFLKSNMENMESSSLKEICSDILHNLEKYGCD